MQGYRSFILKATLKASDGQIFRGFINEDYKNLKMGKPRHFLLTPESKRGINLYTIGKSSSAWRYYAYDGDHRYALITSNLGSSGFDVTFGWRQPLLTLRRQHEA